MSAFSDVWNFIKDTRDWKEMALAARKVPELEARLAALEARLSGQAPGGVVCDHCGSTTLTRTGSRPNPRFGRVGIKDALYRCDNCGKETADMQTPA